jgi:hypothetical protein
MLSALERKNTDILLRMWNDPATEWRRLTEHYKSLCDEELQELSADLSDLTEVAQQVLRDEMKTRGLSDSRSAPSVAPKKAEISEEPPRWELDFATIPPATGIDEDSDPDKPVEYTWKTVLCDCESREQVSELTEVLRRAGIDSWTRSNGRRYPQIVVAADQLEQARMIASQPIPQDIVEEVKADVEGPPEFFESPHCPSCGAEEPTLEGADPTNQWRCEACGRQWVETENASAAGGRE